ncbi:WWE domain-containing protein [Trichonephila clavipes]|nr:WWE domain-containing protein [Trichonephila clavipes]
MQTVLIGDVPKILCCVPPMARVPMVRHPCPRNAEMCDFVWQYEQRKRWLNYTDEQIQILNKAVKERKTNVLLPSKNVKKQFIIDFEKMIQKNKTSRYEQKIRCLVINSDFILWAWKDNFDDWHSYQPHLSFYIEVAYQKKEKTLKFSSLGDFEVNFETWEQVNLETFSINLVRRENVDLVTTVETNNICMRNEMVFKEVCSDEIIKRGHTCNNVATMVGRQWEANNE